MRKLVLGIGLVVCLDVAFIWIIADADEAPEIAHAVVPHAAVPIVHEQPSLEPIAIEDAEEPQENPTAWSPRLYRTESRVEVRNGPAAHNPKSVEVPDPSLEAKRLFPDKIILIGRTEPAPEPVLRVSNEETDVSRSQDAEKSAEPKKRSFESRALGVIKKPYTWMRSLGEKIF